MGIFGNGRGGQFLTKAFLLLGGVVGGLLLAEACVRAFGLADHLVTDPIFAPAGTPHLRYHYKPGLRARAQGSTNLQTNSLGFRDVEHSPVPPDSTVRLVVLGDSFTFGQGVAFPDIYTQILGREMSRLVSPWKVEVMNFGVQGFTVGDEVGAYLDVASACHPHIAILAMISDDLSAIRAENFVDPKGYLTKRVGGTSPLKAYLRRSRLVLLAKEAYLHWMYKRLGTRSSGPVTSASMRSKLDLLNQCLDQFLTACTRDGVIPVFALLDSWYGPETRTILEHVRSGHPDLKVVDCTAAITQFPRDQMVDRRTGHPSGQGHTVIAQTLQGALLPLVRSRISQP